MIFSVAMLLNYPCSLAGNRRTGVHDADIRTEHALKNRNKEGEMGAPENQLIDPGILERLQIVLRNCFGVSPIHLASLDESNEVGADLGHHIDITGKPI